MNKTVLITGAAKGIGAQIARDFAKEGYNVLINYNLSYNEALKLKQELLENGSNVEIYQADISNRAKVDEMIEFCIERTLKPIIVIPPVHPSLAVKFTGKFRENYIYSFIREANQKNVLFLDYIDDIRFSEDKLYRNSFCLNENGARLFTNILLKDTGLL